MELQKLTVNPRATQLNLEVERLGNRIVRSYDDVLGRLHLGGRAAKYDDVHYEFIGGSGDTNSGASIIGLAQMADLVTQSQLLEVTQDEYKIRLKREGDYALSCEFYPGQYHTVETPLGREVCGWEEHQLIFKTVLPEGLTIQQVLSLAPDGQRLNIATTVISDRVTSPFTVNRVYVQYVPQDDGYSCKMTISKGRVCTTEKSR